MIKVKTKIPSGSLTLLTKPNAAGECAVYLRYYLGSYIKKSTDIWVNQKDWDSKRQCVKSSAKNAARINARLYDIKQREQNEQIAGSRRAQVGTGDRSERIRTYNYPQNRVTDHRIGLTLYHLEKMLNGDLGELIDALLTAEAAQKMQNS